MSPDSAARHYRGDAGARYHCEKRGVPDCAVPWIAQLRVEKIAPWVRKTDVVLEYGVGAGWNLAALACQKKIGFDVAEFLAPAVSALGIEFISETRTIPEGSIDVVICHHTLEHVLNPAEVLAEMRRMLRRDGKLLLFVPHEHEGKYLEFNRDEPNHHLYSWNAQTLGNLVEECGFKVVGCDIGRFGYDRFASVWSAKLHTGVLGFRTLRSFLHVLKPAFEVRIVAVR
jgi:SAM-dependent methyltransferase